jgi:predicted RNA-binding Zn ribbon-like protein
MVRTSAAQLPRYQRLVDGLVLPAAVAGDPVLDFCNTRAGWGAAAAREYLTSYDHLAVWAGEAGLIGGEAATRLRRSSRRNPAEASLALARSLRLRDAVYAACTERGTGEAWDVVAAEARSAAAATELVGDAPPGRRWQIPESAGLGLPALALARAAGAFLDSTDLGTVGRCPGHDCGWLFVDRRGRRRWCLMAVCGNRAKARRHARRAAG